MLLLQGLDAILSKYSFFLSCCVKILIYKEMKQREAMSYRQNTKKYIHKLLFAK